MENKEAAKVDGSFHVGNAKWENDASKEKQEPTSKFQKVGISSDECSSITSSDLKSNDEVKTEAAQKKVIQSKCMLSGIFDSHSNRIGQNPYGPDLLTS